MDLLLEKKVDLILQAHAHSYQRSEQLICLEPEVYLSQCVVGTTANGSYFKGAGSMIVISGVFGGTDLRTIYLNDPDYNYLADRGFVHYTLTQMTLQADFVGLTTTYTDRFLIEASSFVSQARRVSRMKSSNRDI